MSCAEGVTIPVNAGAGNHRQITDLTIYRHGTFWASETGKKSVRQNRHESRKSFI